ncbi:MAG: hypothetical protein AAFV29_11805 [Myxococcota bacterium]
MSGLKSSEDRGNVPLFDVGDSAGYEDGTSDPAVKHTEFAVGLAELSHADLRARLREEQKTPVIPELASRQKLAHSPRIERLPRPPTPQPPPPPRIDLQRRPSSPKKKDVDLLDAAPTPVIHPRLAGAPAPDGPLTSLAGVQPLSADALYAAEAAAEADVASQARAVAASVDAVLDASEKLGQAQAQVRATSEQAPRSPSLPLGAAPLDPSAFSESSVVRVERLIDAVIDEVGAAEEAMESSPDEAGALVDDLVIEAPQKSRRPKPGAGFSRAENKTQHIDGEAAAIDRAVFRSIVTGIRPPASAPRSSTPSSLESMTAEGSRSVISSVSSDVDMKVVLGQAEASKKALHEEASDSSDTSGLELAFEPKARFTPRRPKASTARIEIEEPVIAPITRWVVYIGAGILAVVAVYTFFRG